MQSEKTTPLHSEASRGDTREFDEAYNEYTQNVYSLMASTSLQQPLVAAYGEYCRVLQSAINDEDVQRQAADAYGKYLQVLQQALTQPSIQQGTAEAFRRYLAATRQAWSTVDVDTLDPLLLVGIAQSMMFAAVVAAGNVTAIWTSPATSPPASEAST
jgi:hypothetical protein